MVGPQSWKKYLFPPEHRLFTASRGKGAFLNQKRMRASARKSLDAAVVATAFPFRERDQLQAYARVFQAVFGRVEDFRRAGTASLDLAWTAAGRLDGYFEAGLQPWDVAAGALLVREAGGVVMDFEGSDAGGLGRTGHHHPGVLADLLQVLDEFGVTGVAAASHLGARYETLLAIHILSVALLLIWLPFGKLMHFFLVFVTRSQTGAHLSHRGAQQ